MATQHTSETGEIILWDDQGVSFSWQRLQQASVPRQGLTCMVTGLHSIEPDMITDATHNARAVADRFAADSGSKVGSVRQAVQRGFSIVPADQARETGNGNFGPDSGLMKTVRVVA